MRSFTSSGGVRHLSHGRRCPGGFKLLLPPSGCGSEKRAVLNHCIWGLSSLRAWLLSFVCLVRLKLKLQQTAALKQGCCILSSPDVREAPDMYQRVTLGAWEQRGEQQAGLSCCGL